MRTRRSASLPPRGPRLPGALRLGGSARGAPRSELGVAGVREYLAARGVAVERVNEVEPNVEDLFVSFVDRERKARVRAQLRALRPAER